MNSAIISVPTYNGMLHFKTSEAIRFASKTPRQHGLHYLQSSLLAKCFNQLWVHALGRRSSGATHFAMLHADVVPETYWLDKMLEIAEANKADVLSVVMAMKSGHGLTSTGIDGPDLWRPRRFTLKEIAVSHATFTDPNLVVNTGLMLVDLRAAWVEKVCFTIRDAIEVHEDGTREAVSEPEDWNFSRQVRTLGGSVWATSAVKAEHLGTASYPNYGAWGSLEKDTG